MKLNGLICEIITPFNGADELDAGALRQLIRNCMAGGCDALLAAGPLGEAGALTPAEYKKLLCTTTQEAGDKVPVIAGCFSVSVQQAVAAARVAAAAGAAALAAVPPASFGISRQALCGYYAAIAEASPIPVLVYNASPVDGNILEPDSAKLLAASSGIAGLIECSGDERVLAGWLEACKGQELTVLCGADRLAADARAMGAAGVVSAAGGALPAVMARVYSGAAGNEEWEPLRALLCSAPGPAEIKALLSAAGLEAGKTRLPTEYDGAGAADEWGRLFRQHCAQYSIKTPLPPAVVIKPKQGSIEELVGSVEMPQMAVIAQHFKRPKLEDIPLAVRAELNRPEIIERIKPGMSIALTGGSRGVANIALITREVAHFLMELGAKPFITPAMGSHGGATAAGQLDILTGYGLTEEYCGCPVRATMETVKIGTAGPDKLPVYIDRYAAEADGIVPINRVKAHTSFRGTYESGVVKIMTIGMGKQKGAESLHDLGFEHFNERLPQFASTVLDKLNILFGVATLENAYDETFLIRSMLSEDIMQQEPELLKLALENMPRILIPEADVLVVKQIGKNYSGSGMDPNVSGTFATPYATGGLKKKRVVVLDLSEESHGNFIGAGMSDYSTDRLYAKIDRAITYPNALTSTVPGPAKLPILMENDKLAIQAAIKTCNLPDRSGVRVVMIENTLDIERIYISASLLEQARENPDIEILSEPEPLKFDDNGNLM